MAEDRVRSRLLGARGLEHRSHRINGPVDTPSAAELLRTLIRFDTSNPPGDERACVTWIAEQLAAAGIEHRILTAEPTRPNLVGRVPGRGDAPPLLVYGHLDVVPANASEWTHPPFAGELSGDEIWGRGALDMKSGVAMYLHAALRLRQEAVAPAGDVIIAFTSDEETGSTRGARFLVEQHPDLFAGVRYGLSELGGFTQWISGRRFYPIQVAEKQFCVVRATFRGPSGHASTIVPDSAMAKLGRFLRSLDKKRLPVHVTPPVRHMLEQMSAGLPAVQRLALRPLLQPRLTDRLLDVLGKDGRDLDPLLHNTATPTVVAGGESVNVIPSEVTVDLDGRVLPGQTPSDLLRELERHRSGDASFEIVREEPAAPALPDLTLLPLLDGVFYELDPSAPTYPLVLPGYTDARHFARLGIQTYGFMPLKLERGGASMSLVHAPDERVPATAVEFGAEAVYRACVRYSL